MGHSVQLVIGKDPAIGRFLKRWPGSRAVPLKDGWMAIPMEDALYALIEGALSKLERAGISSMSLRWASNSR